MDSSFGAPDKLTDIILLPVVLTIIGIVIWFIGWNTKKNLGRVPKWHPLCYAVWAIALYVGMTFLWRVINPFDHVAATLYSDTVFYSRLYYAHIIDPFIPLLAILILGGWQIWDARQDRLAKLDI